MKEIILGDGYRVALIHRRYGLIYILGYAWYLWYEKDI